MIPQQFAGGGLGGPMAGPVPSYGGLGGPQQFAGGPPNGGLGGSRMPTDMRKKMIFVPQQRSRINIVGVVVNVFLPWLLFTAVTAVLAFEIHYKSPNLAWALTLAGYGVALVTACIAISRKIKDKDPCWYTYAAGAFFVGCVLATLLGNQIFFQEVEKYFDYMTLNTYTAVNPAHETGQMVMDSGRVYFSDGVKLDIDRTMAFKHHDTYCVAPIDFPRGDKLQTYDFWAVGVNCCDNPRKFHCGSDVDNWRSRSGLRLMNEEQRPFFRLAVQQAEAAYDLTAAHPVFFYWSQDPLKDIHMYMHRGIRMFLKGSFAIFIINFCAVISATFAFAKMGRVK